MESNGKRRSVVEIGVEDGDVREDGAEVFSVEEVAEPVERAPYVADSERPF
jgi:hypothetical protein